MELKKNAQAQVHEAKHAHSLSDHERGCNVQK
jgi:hypothetical protein